MAFTKKIAGWIAGRIKGEKARKATMRWMEKTGLGMILDAAGDYALAQGAIKGAGALKGLMTGQKAAQAAQQTQAAIAAGPKPSASLITGSMPPAPARAISQAVATPSPAGLGMSAAPAAAPTITPQLRMPQMPSALPAKAAGGAAPMPSFTPTPRPTLPPAPSPMRAMVAPPAAPPAVPPTGGMTPAMTGTAQRMGGLQNVANANIAGGPGGFRGAMQFARENAGWLGPAATATGNVIGSYITSNNERAIEQEKLDREQDAKNRLAMLLMPMFQAQLGQYTQQYGTPTLPPPPGGR